MSVFRVGFIIWDSKVFTGVMNKAWFAFRSPLVPKAVKSKLVYREEYWMKSLTDGSLYVGILGTESGGN